MFKRVALSMTLFGAMLAMQPVAASAQDFGHSYHDRDYGREYAYRGDRGRDRDWQRDDRREQEWRNHDRREEWRDRDYRAYRQGYYGGSAYFYGGGTPAYGYGYSYSAPCR